MLQRVDCHGVSDRGSVRESNEDRFLIADLKKSAEILQTNLDYPNGVALTSASHGKLLVVADGVGGHAAGSRASTLAVDRFAEHVLNHMQWPTRHEDPSDDHLRDAFTTLLTHCQEAILAEAAAMPEKGGMGTTMTIAYILWPRLFIAHVGDSRCYLYRRPNMEQLTEDHTLAQAAADRGISGSQSQSISGMSHVLWNVIGGVTDDLEPQIRRATLMVGDTLLLCTDGLNRGVSESEIAEVLGADASAEGICRQLIEAANEAGGRDNTTVIIARFPDARQENAAAQEHAGRGENSETAVLTSSPRSGAGVSRNRRE
jgi:protein phosphatase